MPDWKVESDWIRKVLHVLFYDFMCILAKWVIVLHICELPYHQSGKISEKPGPFQLDHHAVQVVELFAYVFQKEDISFGNDF
jgi:hypothetical protein